MPRCAVCGAHFVSFNTRTVLTPKDVDMDDLDTQPLSGLGKAMNVVL